MSKIIEIFGLDTHSTQDWERVIQEQRCPLGNGHASKPGSQSRVSPLVHVLCFTEEIPVQ